MLIIMIALTSRRGRPARGVPKKRKTKKVDLDDEEYEDEVKRVKEKRAEKGRVSKSKIGESDREKEGERAGKGNEMVLSLKEMVMRKQQDWENMPDIPRKNPGATQQPKEDEIISRKSSNSNDASDKIDLRITTLGNAHYQLSKKQALFTYLLIHHNAQHLLMLMFW